jgi:hypothetical protein
MRRKKNLRSRLVGLLMVVLMGCFLGQNILAEEITPATEESVPASPTELCSDSLEESDSDLSAVGENIPEPSPAAETASAPDISGEKSSEDGTGSLRSAVVPQGVSANSSVRINEVESQDNEGGEDWIEIINVGSSDADISGWFVTDSDGLKRLKKGKTTPLPEGSVLKAGEVLVLEGGRNFSFGLGNPDSAVLYNRDQEVVDSYSYEDHAAGSWSRVIGSNNFVDQAPTKGTPNLAGGNPSPEGSIVINEVDSSPADWVELKNIGTADIDISGYELRDSSNNHRWQFPESSVLHAGDRILVSPESIGPMTSSGSSYANGAFKDAMGLGSSDSIRLFDPSLNLVDSFAWTAHASWQGSAASASYGRYPDGTGDFVLMPESAGKANASWYTPSVVINEIESNGDATDWVEICNTGSDPIDLSGWYLLDSEPDKHLSNVTPIAEGTFLAPGGYFVFEQGQDFSFGLGKSETITIHSKSGLSVAEYSYTSHASGVWARIPDAAGDFVDFATATKGTANFSPCGVILNEIESDDAKGGADWIELANPTGESLDISGLVIQDSNADHSYTVPEGTVIPASGFLVLDETTLGFALGKSDSVRIFENDILIQSVSWEAHADQSLGLYPDTSGSEYRNTKLPTPGAANKFDGVPEEIAWPGGEEVAAFDDKAGNGSGFLEDSSGLDFADGKLYAVDNGTGRFWILDVAPDGTLSFSEGFENGKRIRFSKDASNPSAKGPDAEGITVDGSGLVYIASERDNENKGVNQNTILMVDPKAEGPDLPALKSWNLTDSLPSVPANEGIEAVEWVSADEINGKILDQNTGLPFHLNQYPGAFSGGIFFVGLESNGHVYAYVLNGDGSIVQIADIDPKLGGVMALDYDPYEHALWAVSDEAVQNKSAKITFNGTGSPEIIHVLPASGMDVKTTNEGFAIADASYTQNGKRPVYHFADGVKNGSLTIGSLNCDYSPKDRDPGDDSPSKPDTGEIKPDLPAEDPGESGKTDTAASEKANSISSKSAAPNTGDESRFGFWAVLFLLSGIALFIKGREWKRTGRS